MEMILADFLGMPAMTGAFWIFVVIAGLWELIWKGIALWKCGRNNQLPWFVAILILNTLGILPIVYLLFFQKKTAVKTTVVAESRAKPAKRSSATKKSSKKSATKKKASKKKK